jgi:hypothetical protein
MTSLPVGSTLYMYEESYRQGTVEPRQPPHEPDHPPRLQVPKSEWAGTGQDFSGLVRFRAETASTPWQVFVDAGGAEQGGIEPGGAGAVFRGKGGDFAEWHRRDPSEKPFEEGDVVGFDGDSMILTRRTIGMKMVGVITRMTVIEGSCPPASQRHLYDTVAYVGQVPVKVRGRCQAGDVLVPSGKQDGTAVANAVGQPLVTLGRAMDLGVEGGFEWNLVMTSVVNPSSTVSGKREGWARAVFAALVLLLMTAVGELVYEHYGESTAQQAYQVQSS